MLVTFSSPLAGLLGLTVPPLVSILIPIAAFIFAGSIAISAMYFKHQQRQQWHETARLALEKGQPVPPMPNDEEGPRHRRKGGDIRAGLVLIATGIGLFLMFSSMSNKNGAGFIGAIPGLVGVALLLHGILTGQLSKDRGDADRRPPTT